MRLWVIFRRHKPPIRGGRDREGAPQLPGPWSAVAVVYYLMNPATSLQAAARLLLTRPRRCRSLRVKVLLLAIVRPVELAKEMAGDGPHSGLRAIAEL